MKKKVKIFVTMLVMTSLLIFNNGAVHGAESIDGDVELMYVNTSSVSSILTINSGIATCKGINVMTKNYTSKITMTLQKSTDNSTYSKVQLWSQEYTGTGSKTLSKTKTLTKGYYYRVRVVVRIYSGGEVIEKITKFSNVFKY